MKLCKYNFILFFSFGHTLSEECVQMHDMQFYMFPLDKGCISLQEIWHTDVL